MREALLEQKLAEAQAALRWVYMHGMRPDYDRPDDVSAAFNDAFAPVRAGEPVKYRSQYEENEA